MSPEWSKVKWSSWLVTNRISCEWADDQSSQLRTKIPAHKEQASNQELPAQNLQVRY
jgi:hypothetical protein